MAYVSMDTVIKYNIKEKDAKIHRDRVVCADGFTMSVQASSFNYCTPRIDNAGWYTHFEVGFPSAVEPLLMPYCEDDSKPTDTVYAYVPVEVITAVVNKHGGLGK